MDRGTVLGSRLDGKRSIQHFQSLLHADEAKAPARFYGFFLVKAHARITDREMNLAGRSPQSHFEVANATVFGGIAEGFLQNPEEAKRNVGRQNGRQIVGLEINLHFLLRLEFVAEAFRSCTQGQEIAVWTNATHATRSGYLPLSRQSASGVRRCARGFGRVFQELL